MSELRERFAQAIMAEDLLQDDRAKNEPDYCSVDARVDAVMSVLASWQSLMAILDEHYPPEVFDGSSGDEGPRIVALTREIDRLQHEIMGYQAPGGEYDRGHEHGSDVAAKFRAERDRERASRQAWAEEADYLQHLLEQFVDRDPCWFDHHGGCQAHGFLDIEAGQLCPQEEVRRALDDGLADHMSRVCACVTDEQAAVLPPGFSRPMCAVHPEAEQLTDKPLPYPAQFYPGCPCHACDGPTWPPAPWGGRMRIRMSLCPNCGNKRCPSAANHTNECSGSNDPGQVGGLYAYDAVPSDFPCCEGGVTSP